MIYPYWGMDINPFMEFCISIEGTSIVAWTMNRHLLSLARLNQVEEE